MDIQIGHSTEKFSESAKATIEPITQLLFKDVNWTEELHQSAAQVFVDFVCNKSLSNHHLPQLLRSSTWGVPTLKFVENIALLDQSFWKKNTVDSILSVLQIMLADVGSPDVQIQAAQTLAGLVSQCLNSEDILRTPGVTCDSVTRMPPSHNPAGRVDFSKCIVRPSHDDMDNFSVPYDTIKKLALFPPLLPVLVKSLADERNGFLQMQAATAVQSLACTMDSKFLHRIVNFPLLLKTLVTLLRESQNPGLQSRVAWALGSLANGADEAGRKQIANFPDLLDSLKRSLDRDDNPNLQVEAARTLLNLDWTSDTHTVLQILAVSLDREDDHFLQQRASRALDDLACKDDAMKDQLLVFPGLLEKLAKSLDNDLNFALAMQSARALLNLTATTSTSIMIRILSSPLLLENLTASLCKSQNPGLQSIAVDAICNLACGRACPEDFAMKAQLASFPDLLQNLGIALDQDADTKLRSQAANALINLSVINNASIKIRVLSSPVVLKNLVALLRQSEDVLLQADAAWAIENLVADGADQALREEVASFPDLIICLENSLERQDNRYLQVQAAVTLIRLGWTEDIVKLLPILAVALEVKQNPELRIPERAALGLAFLASGSDVLKGQMLDFSGLLENLINSLHYGGSFFQWYVAEALLNLASTTEVSIKVRLLSSSTLLQNLVAVLRKDQDPLLQARIASIIARLADEGANQTVREQISAFPNLLDTLEDCLEKDNPYLRVQASKTLMNLAWAKDTPKLLRILAISFVENQDPVLQARAAAGLLVLADGDDAMKNKILDYPELFHNLVRSLEDDRCRDLPVEAARSLSNLASTTDNSIKSRILSSPLLLKSLVVRFERSDNVELKRTAASMIANLSGAGADAAVRQQIANFPGLLDQLYITMGNRSYPLLQTDAARALSNLPHTKDEDETLTIMLDTQMKQ